MNFTGNILRIAQKQGFAIPAFNYLDIWGILAVLETAEVLSAPCYIAAAPLAVNTLGLDFCAAMGRAAFVRSNGMVWNHLDHCVSVDVCRQAVDLGFPSVMIDCSRMPLEQNIASTRQVVEYAHANGVIVEAELGQIYSNSDEADGIPTEYVATPETCAELVEKTGVDSLAIGIGNQHGFYSKPPQLNIDLLRQAKALVDVPLVLHGSTGLSDDDVRACIAHGVCKVNVGTAIHHAYKTAVQQCINDHPDKPAITSFTLPAKENMKKELARWICLVGADGKQRFFM